MREVFERLEAMALPWFLTGSEALARYGQPRQTMDIDVVVAIALKDFVRIEDAFKDRYLVNPPIDAGVQSMASLVAMSALVKVDLMIGRQDPWSTSAMGRRERWEHPDHGSVWVVSLEDLILAKLEWAGGVSELQLRDCRNLVVANRDHLDWPYLERWARALDLSQTLERVRDAT